MGELISINSFLVKMYGRLAKNEKAVEVHVDTNGGYQLLHIKYEFVGSNPKAYGYKIVHLQN